jgi:hypothetical protein
MARARARVTSRARIEARARARAKTKAKARARTRQAVDKVRKGQDKPDQTTHDNGRTRQDENEPAK